MSRELRSGKERANKIQERRSLVPAISMEQRFISAYAGCRVLLVFAKENVRMGLAATVFHPLVEQSGTQSGTLCRKQKGQGLLHVRARGRANNTVHGTSEQARESFWPEGKKMKRRPFGRPCFCLHGMRKCLAKQRKREKASFSLACY